MAAIRLGVLVSLEEGLDVSMRKVRDLGFPTCQVSCWSVEQLTRENARALRDAADDAGVEITTFWAGTPGRRVWNFIEGPATIGLVPSAWRAERLGALKRGSDFAGWVGGIPSITTHVGFIPEAPDDPAYAPTVAALRDLVAHCQGNGQEFWFETGQETPITLLRTIEDIGLPNVGVNLDPANLLLYGKANPLDALDILGPYVRGVHAKDGEYPTNGRELGKETPLGQGRVNFPALVARLKELGYGGALTIEREISGDRQIADILTARAFLESLLST
ncbi:MAG: sugar phosphate isomerase/epimerase [Chloroflexota bacterium]